jgi:hypothetical protein
MGNFPLKETTEGNQLQHINSDSGGKKEGTTERIGEYFGVGEKDEASVAGETLAEGTRGDETKGAEHVDWGGETSSDREARREVVTTRTEGRDSRDDHNTKKRKQDKSVNQKRKRVKRNPTFS